MSYTIEYDSTVWYPVPAAFPFGGWPTETHWLAEFVEMFEKDLGAIPEDGRIALLEFATAALADRPPLVSESLIFCPRVTPVLGLVNVLVVPADGDSDLVEIVSADSRAQFPPTIEEVTTAELGVGARAATIIDSTDGENAAGAFTYAFTQADQLVVIGGTADRIPDATAMLPFLERLVEGIRLEVE